MAVQRIMVGMSGGVDSAVAAMLLKDAGHDVAALFMKNWDDDDGTELCTAAADLLDAEAVCHRLRIPLHVANFAHQYWDGVFADFLASYRAGRTPNPDVLCNREIKFRVFADHAATLGADRIATGHYARLLPAQDAPVALHKGVDGGKDQSYFLHAVSAGELARASFPLGNLHKRDVRALAASRGLHNHARPDSTGICFIGERRMQAFLRRYLPAQAGPIETPDGKRLGEHAGLMFHTIGQRAGLGIGGVAGAAEAPWYVAGKRVADNTLVVVQGNAHPLLFRDVLTAHAVHWLVAAGLPRACVAKTRYRQPDQACTVEALSADASRVRVTFATPQRALTPGQYVVFYEGDRCLGGGVID
jgi:tRNA-specific 2-thiouridylase